MLAYYRDGRQAEALGSYQRAERSWRTSWGSTLRRSCSGFTSGSCSRIPGSICGANPCAATGSSRRSTTVHRGRLPGHPTPRRTRRGRQDRSTRASPPTRRSSVASTRRPSHRGPGASAHRPDLRLLAGTGSCLHRVAVPARREPSSARGARGTAGAGPSCLRVVEQVSSALAFAHRKGSRTGTCGVQHPVRRRGQRLPRGLPVRRRIGARRPRRTSGSSPGSPSAAPDEALLGELAESAELGTRCAGGGCVRRGRPHGPRTRGDVSRRAEERNPYKGLRAFPEADARDFFGRGELTRRLLERLREAGRGRFLAVVGPSGAGSHPSCGPGWYRRSGTARSGTGGAFVAEMFPGATPWTSSRPPSCASPSGRPAPGPAGAGLSRPPRGVGLSCPAEAEVMLVVDQFEEVFTLTEDEAERERSWSLRVAVADPDSRLRVMVTLRADFYDRPLLYPASGSWSPSGRKRFLPSPRMSSSRPSAGRPRRSASARARPGGRDDRRRRPSAGRPATGPVRAHGDLRAPRRRPADPRSIPGIGGIAGALSARPIGSTSRPIAAPRRPSRSSSGS